MTQQVFAKLITAIVKYDERGVPFFAWLVRLARNVAIDHLRANRTCRPKTCSIQTPCAPSIWIAPKCPGGTGDASRRTAPGGRAAPRRRLNPR